MRTSNPVLSKSAFGWGTAQAGSAMTVNGTINKTFFLLLCTLITALWSWDRFFLTRDLAAASPYMTVGAFGGFVLALVTTFKQSWAPVTAPLYALLEGLFLGCFSALMELRFPGIAVQSVALTFGTCACLLVAYRTRVIRVSRKFALGVFAATGGIAVVYLLTMVLGFFGIQMPIVYSNSPLGILFSLVVVVVAALNLVLDFNFIEQAAYRGAPKYMEWYSGFALMITLVWLYLEIIRLLAKLRDERR